MTRNFGIRVPTLSKKPKSRKKVRDKLSADNSKNVILDTIQETKHNETRGSSYYSFKSDLSESNLKILETYDEFLNLKDIDHIIWRSPNNISTSEETDQSESKIKINEGMFLLKQICNDFKNPLDVICPQNGYQIKSLFQTNPEKFRKYDLKTAIIAQRIANTQKQIEKSRESSKIGFFKDNLGRGSSSQGKSISTSRTADKLSNSSTVFSQSLSKTLSNLTSKYVVKPTKVATGEFEIQVDLIPDEERLVSHSCNTQTELLSTEDTIQPKNVASKTIQTTRKTKYQNVQTTIVTCQDKYINTNATFYPIKERSTQMYEHITENDLFCMEWINKNLFKVPVNPNAVVVDEKLKDSSECTCKGTSFFDQELIWERQALCL